MKIDVSTGEVFDKVSILEIKQRRISDPVKLNNIQNELFELIHSYNVANSLIYGTNGMSGSVPSSVFKDIKDDFYQQLLVINETLWGIEDAIRDKERKKEFDEEFIQLARSVYFNNDKRSEIKRQINIKYQSAFIEEKSYEKY